MDKGTFIFFGEDAFSNIVLLSLLKEGYTIPLVVTPLYQNDIHKRLEHTALQNGIEYRRVENINSEFILEKVQSIKPDLLIVAHFEKLLKGELIRIPTLGCLNLHPSLLPYYRGLAPQHWPIINGEKKTGITVHFIDEGVDTGNIVLQREIEINDDMYVSDLQMIWAKEYQTVMNEAVKKVIAGYRGKIQNMNEGSYYGKLKPEQCEINILNGVRAAYNLIRGVSMPYHGAYLQKQNETVIIWKAEIVSDTPETPVGEIVKDRGNAYLSFGDGMLILTKYSILTNSKEI